MNISLEKVGNVQAVITVKLETADYEANVKKSLKNLQAKVQMPGFRPGHVPASLVKKMYGTQVKAEEVNKLIGDNLMSYIRDNKVNMLGEPLPSATQQPQDIEKQNDFEFVFDIALAPEFTATLSADDHVKYYDIQVSEEELEDQVKQFASRAGHNENVNE